MVVTSYLFFCMSFAEQSLLFVVYLLLHFHKVFRIFQSIMKETAEISTAASVVRGMQQKYGANKLSAKTITVPGKKSSCIISKRDTWTCRTNNVSFLDSVLFLLHKNWMGFILDINSHVIWSHEKYTTEVCQWTFQLAVSTFSVSVYYLVTKISCKIKIFSAEYNVLKKKSIIVQNKGSQK